MQPAKWYSLIVSIFSLILTKGTFYTILEWKECRLTEEVQLQQELWILQKLPQITNNFPELIHACYPLTARKKTDN